jgi:copper chaperone
MIEFEVKDMTCGHCVSTITRAIKESVPSADVAVELDSHRITIHGAPSAADIERAIREVGYTPVALH